MSDEILREVADLLFGGGASDLIAKATAAEKERKARGVTAGLSAVGGVAGAYGLGLAGHEINLKAKEAQKATPSLRRMGALRAGVRATPGRTKALIPIEMAGLGGEVMATKFLHEDAKKIKKSNPDCADLHVPSAGLKKTDILQPQKAKRKLIKIGAKKAEPKTKMITTQAVKEVTFTDDRHLQKEAPSITWEGEISKVNTDKRQVFGWASIVEKDGQPIVDLQGDFMDIEEIEKSAYDYVIKSRKGGNQHQRNGEEPHHVSDLIESLIVTPEKKAALGLPEETPLGWWVGFKVNDDQTWDEFKTGKRTQFSIHGRGRREVVHA